MSRPLRTAAALGLWCVLWLAPWHVLVASTALRAGMALLAFLLPGFLLSAWLDDGRRLDLAARVPAGLAISLALTGIVGLAGSLLHLPLFVVQAALFLAGALGIALVARRGGFERPRPPRGAELAALALDGLAVAIAVLVAASLVTAHSAGGDDVTYAARVAAFQQHPLGFERIGFASDSPLPSRYWLAFWSLAEALIADRGAVLPLELHAYALAPWLVGLALLASFALARSLGASRRLAAIGVVAQVALLLAWSRAEHQPGRAFFNGMVEDKSLALFVLAPVFFRDLVRVFERPSPARTAAAALSYVAIAVCHPTSLGMVFLVAAGFSALEVLARGASRPLLALLLVVLAVTALAASIRFVRPAEGQQVYFDLESASEGGGLTHGRAGKVERGPGGFGYGVSSRVVGPGVRVAGVALLGFAAWRWRSDRAARFVAASLAVPALATLPLTGWILGLALTPFHLVRTLRLVPLAVVIAFALRAAGDAAQRLAARLRVRVVRRVSTGAAAGSTALVVAVAILAGTLAYARVHPAGFLLYALHQPRPERGDVLVRCRVGGRSVSLPYRDLGDLAHLLRSSLTGPTVVLGDGCLNDLIPGFAADARLVSFRGPAELANHAGLPTTEARRRFAGYRKLVTGALAPADGARLLRRHDVRLVVALAPHPWLDGLAAAGVGRSLVGRAGSIELYAIAPAAGPAAGTDTGAAP